MIFQSRAAPPLARRFSPPVSRPLLQRKCACGGTPGPTGECESCRKKRLQRRPSGASQPFLRTPKGTARESLGNELRNAPSFANDLRIDESGASEAEAEAIAERIVTGATASTQSAIQRRAPTGAIQRQRKAEDILPQGHLPASPTMRPVGAEMVRGFAVTRATCQCKTEVAAREKAIEGRIAAYTACGQRKDVRDPFALEACARQQLFGGAGPKVPALGTADPDTSTVQLADASALALREKLLGEPAEGPCVALRMRALLVHEGRHLDQFDEVAKSISPAFFAEFKKLEGDAGRMTKLATKFPNETRKYENEWQRSVSTNVRAETESYTAERDFYGEVRTAWSKICASTVPAPNVGPPQGGPGRTQLQRHPSIGGMVAQGAVPAVVPEVIGGTGQSLDATTRTFMEGRFGHDFGQVRVHADARAAESAQAVNAEAYTVGQHIVFAANRYDPASTLGRRLLAHELTHTLQQGDSSRPVGISHRYDESEKEADAVAERMPGANGSGHSAGPPNRFIHHQRRNGTWLARQEAPWPPPWHEGALKAIARFAGPSDGKSADPKWPQMQAYLCKLSQEQAGSLLRRWSSLSDNFARYIHDKFPTNHKNIITILSDLKEGKQPGLCAPAPSAKTNPVDKPAPKKEDAPTSSSDDESHCQVDVRATNAGFTASLAGAKHLFVVVTDKVGNQYGARGGPDVPGGLFALIETDFGRYESGLFPDFDPGALSLTVLSGPEACGKKDCISDACREIDDAEVGYEAYGPNSNSVVGELLKICGMSHEKPDVWAPGWDVPLFGPKVSGTGGEEGGPSYGDDTGGGGYHQ